MSQKPTASKTQPNQRKLSEIDRETLQFTREAIFERRKTQHQFVLFYLAAVGVSAGIAFGSSGTLSAHSIYAFMFPIFLAFPVHQFCCYQRMQIARLHQRRQKLIGDPVLKHWQSWYGMIATSATLLSPVFLIPPMVFFAIGGNLQAGGFSKPFKGMCYLAAAVLLVSVVTEIVVAVSVRRQRKASN